MLQKFLLPTLLLAGFSALTQDTNFTYFDSNWKETTKEKAIYYRKAFQNSNKLWEIHDYYGSTGKLQMSGTYLKKNLKKQHGEFVYYYENGELESKSNYFKNTQVGESERYYKGGKRDYLGTYSNGKEHGEWLWYHENGQLASREQYYYGNPNKIEQWDSLGNLEEKPILIQEAHFFGGQEALHKFIIENLVYPSESKLKGQQDEVWVKFVINKDGTLSDFTVTKGSYDLLNQAAIDVMKKSPNWIPGKRHNRHVRYSFTVPINFVLM